MTLVDFNQIQDKKQSGFTLLELLVAFVVVTGLASLATANFLHMKANAFDNNAKQDLLASVEAQEAYYVDNAAYAPCTDRDDCVSKLPGINAYSENVEIVFTASDESYAGTSYSTSGSGKTFTWSSGVGVDEIS